VICGPKCGILQAFILIILYYPHGIIPLIFQTHPQPKLFVLNEEKHTDATTLLDRAFVLYNLITIHRWPVHLLKFQISPKLVIFKSSVSKGRTNSYVCLGEAKTSHWDKIWVQPSSSVPHILHTGYWSAQLNKMSSQCVISNKEAHNNPALWPFKEQ
jgi:hypothetical protein